MALFNEILEGGLNFGLQRRLGIAGGAPAPTLAPEVMPAFLLGESQFAELFFHQGWRRWQTCASVGPVAGQLSRMKLRVPDAATSSLVVVEHVVVSSTVATIITLDLGYGPGDVDFATFGQTAEFRDGRQKPGSGTVCINSFDTNAAQVPNNGAIFWIPAQTPVHVPGGPWILFAGNAMLLGGSVVNNPVQFTWIWRERAIVSGENV